MSKSSFARGRNWQKARIIGSGIRTCFLTEEEKEIVKEIATLKQKLLENWDKNSKKLGMKVQRYNLTVHTLAGQFFKHNITKQDVIFYTNGLEKEDYKIIKIYNE